MQFSHLPIDDDITEWVVEHRVGWLDTVFHVITTAGNTLSMTIIAIIVAALFARARRTSQALLILLGSSSGWLAMVGLKNLFARDRPPERYRLIAIDSFAFPSGHAMMSGIVLGLVAVALWQRSTWVREHRWVLLIAPLLSLVIGASRVYLGVHWASDVVGGWLFAVIWIGSAVLIQSRTTRSNPAGPTDLRVDSRAAGPGRSSSRTTRPPGRSGS